MRHERSWRPNEHSDWAYGLRRDGASQETPPPDNAGWTQIRGIISRHGTGDGVLSFSPRHRRGGGLLWFNARRLLGLVFYLVITSTSLILRLLGQEPHGPATARRQAQELPDQRPRGHNNSGLAESNPPARKFFRLCYVIQSVPLRSLPSPTQQRQGKT